MTLMIEAAEYLLEVVTPRTNVARLSAAEHLFSVLARCGQQDTPPVSLEIAADAERRRFLVRTASAADVRRVGGQLAAAYPQATLRPFDTASTGDPARVGPDEQVAVMTLELRTGAHLPLRTFQDAELDAAAESIQTDPLLGIVGALGDLPTGWRAISQLVVLGAARADWARGYQRLALERPLEYERRRDSGPSLMGPLVLLGLLALFLVIASVADAWDRGAWSDALGLVAGSVAALVGGIVVVRRLRRREIVDPRLVQAKLDRGACEVELRVAIVAPEFADRHEMEESLGSIAAAYRPFSLAAGNSLVARPVRSHTADLDLRLLLPLRRSSLLNVRELAGLWHLPQMGDDLLHVERTTARRRLPIPAAVASREGSACRIGVSSHQGHAVPIHLPDELLGRHLLAVAKTRRGKSTLLLCMVEHLMQQPGRCLVLVDPHRDLALAALGLVPRHRQPDVVSLDLSNRRRPFGINLLDVGLGWDRDQATANALRIFRREFDGYWGPRMEDAFRFAVLALFEANQALCAADPLRGRSAQHTILDVPAVLEYPGFRRQVLRQTSDPVIRRWFEGYLEPLDRRFQLEIINPVQTKVHRYLGNRVARHIVGQPASTVDFRRLMADGRIVIVNLNAFDVGEDVAALVGGTLLNLAARAISAQASLPRAARQPVTLVVDEFHTIPGADYEQVLGELAKYGANLVLATQTIARLDGLTDAQRTRDLRAAVFSNLDGLFAFHTSAEDASYLAEELGGGLDAQDLLELGQFQYYARVTDARTGERLPSFSVQLEPPPEGDSELASRLARLSAERFGRDVLDVELDIQSALERVRGPRRAGSADAADESRVPGPIPPDTGVPAADGIVAGAEVPES